MAGQYHHGGLFGTGDYAFADGQLPVWRAALQRYVAASLRQAILTGGAAGAHTVPGITAASVLLAVTDLTDLVDLTSEFTITADDTIDNTGGTATTSDKLQVWWFSQ
jgi:hypothetical protein